MKVIFWVTAVLETCQQLYFGSGAAVLAYLPQYSKKHASVGNAVGLAATGQHQEKSTHFGLKSPKCGPDNFVAEGILGH